MNTTEFFHILDRVGSTNNYAMAEVHAGLASHGMAWFAREQNAGRGQRGKAWITKPGENITMSILIEPPAVFANNPFLFNMAISNACLSFLNGYRIPEIKVKWPNDIYIGDRKAGGILIENIYRGASWKWAVAGIGININQVDFPPELDKATSLRKITGENYDAIFMAKALHKCVLNVLTDPAKISSSNILDNYNSNLYMINKNVKLRRGNIVFETTISGVSEDGKLLTTDNLPRQFEFGEIEWIL